MTQQANRDRSRWRRAWWAVAATLALAVPPAGASQLRHDEGLWLVILGQGKLPAPASQSSRLRWWFDGQVRFLEDTDGFHQSLVRPGVGYSIAGSVTAWLGYAWIHTTTLAGATFDEHRVWQQLTWSPRLSGWSLSSRTRLEQRFFSDSSDTGWRLRQFIKAAHPLALHPRLGFAAYDEAFLDLNDTDFGADDGFAQNRLFAGLSWRLDTAGHLVAEAGYLNQILRSSGGSTPMNHLLSLHLLLAY